MSYRIRYKKSTQSSAFFEHLEPMKVLSFLLLVTGLYLVYKWWNKSNTDPETTDPENPKAEDEKADKIKPKTSTNAAWERVKEDTRKIVHHLGVNYSWYDPRRYTENDKEVAILLMQQRPNLHLVEQLFYSVYTKDKLNLKNEVYRLLDKAQLSQVQAYYKSKGSIF